MLLNPLSPRIFPGQMPAKLRRAWGWWTVRVKELMGFDAYRLLFAAWVLVSHASELIDGDRHREVLTRIFHSFSLGDVAVDGFFLLSGFLIVQSWQRQPQVGSFLTKRVLRIYPGFLVASFLSAFVVGALGAGAPGYYQKLEVEAWARSAFLLLPPATPTVFPDLPVRWVNESLWTIAYEFRCYLLVAGIGVCGIFRRRWGFGVAAIVFWCLLRTGLLDRLPVNLRDLLVGDPGHLRRFFIFFAAGGLCFLYRDQIPWRNPWLRAAGAAAVVVALVTNRRVLLLGGACFLFAGSSGVSGRSHTEQRGRLPDVSYGLYLYGWPVQQLFLWYWRELSPVALFAWSLPVGLVCGALSWYLVEGPCLRLKTRVAKPDTSEARAGAEKPSSVETVRER